MPSCSRRTLLWTEWLRDEVLLDVAHRHVVLTIPRLLRPLFRRRRELLGELARAGAEAVKELVPHASGEGHRRLPRPKSPLAQEARLPRRPAGGAVPLADEPRPLGRNFEAMDPLEWLARISDHIPDPGQHRRSSTANSSSRARPGCQALEPDATSTTADYPPPRRRCPPSWARLIAKVYQVDPLVCTRCGRRMSILAFVSDQHSIS